MEEIPWRCRQWNCLQGYQCGYLMTAGGLGLATATKSAKSCSQFRSREAWISASTTVSDCVGVAWMSLKGQQATFTDASPIVALNVRNREALRRFPANSGQSQRCAN
jgi:hypothetical protein